MCTTEITQKDLHDLLEVFEKKAFEAGAHEENSAEHYISKKCEDLFKSDYSLVVLDNTNGALCPRYPSRIFIPEFEASHSNVPSTSAAATNGIINPGVNGLASGIQAYVTFATTSPSQPQQQKTIYEDLYDAAKIRELITMAKYARCRQRFTVPVIMYKGKYVCRSATISIKPETYGRKVFDVAYDCLSTGASTSSEAAATAEDDSNDPTEESLVNNAAEALPFSYDEVIKSDIQLLKALNVSTIVDLMVEQCKVKYFMNVSSSEKADPQNYEEFNILSLPYPGCEFFKKFRDNNYVAKDLFFNWKQSFIDATLSIPTNGPANDIDVNWQDYKKWDLVVITQNYLKATLKCIQEESSGVLVHCISGWDRTPLFISLVRLSLWADGFIHQSLNPLQMTYFTVAYDWYLFGHQLPDRLRRSEDIMFFCFHVLKHISGDDFSAVEHRRRTKTTSSSGSSAVVVRSDAGDEDPPKEDVNFEDSNDSSSNFSNCDMSVTDNQSPSSSNITSRSPNPKRSKTSPISVPGRSASRQRQESVSSSIGSWELVTGAGSLDSEKDSSLKDASNRSSGSNTVNQAKVAPTPRKQRLNAVRAVFIQAYGKTIGLKFREGSTMNLTSFIGALADQLFT